MSVAPIASKILQIELAKVEEERVQKATEIAALEEAKIQDDFEIEQFLDDLSASMVMRDQQKITLSRLRFVCTPSQLD